VGGGEKRKAGTLVVNRRRKNIHDPKHVKGGERGNGGPHNEQRAIPKTRVLTGRLRGKGEGGEALWRVSKRGRRVEGTLHVCAGGMHVGVKRE